MSEPPKITDLAKIVEPHLNGGKLVSYSSRYLTKPGDNYGSLMLAITANVKQANTGEIEELLLVAKLPPLMNELYWKIFQPERTCISENAIYNLVSPALRQLQREAGIAEAELFDLIPRYYGSRISLDPAATLVDRDAVLVQENLQTAGFKAGNRHKLFDFAHTQLVLEQMAQYHALPIALRLKKPAEFDTKVRPYFRKFNMNATMGPEMGKQLQEETIKEVELAMNNNAGLVSRAKRLFELYDAYVAQPDPVDTMFTSIVHCDLWINNLMIQYDEAGAPHKLKFVDFQIAQYESLAHDIVFFLFSSVETAIVDEHLEKFYRIYYEAFVKCLQSVGVSVQDYSFESLLAEVTRIAPTEIAHALFMTKVILADNSTMPEEFKDISMEIFTSNTGYAAITEKTADIIKLAQKYKYI